MFCKVCNKKIKFLELSTNKMCMDCYKSHIKTIKRDQIVEERAIISEEQSIQDEKPILTSLHYDEEYSEASTSTCALLLKIMGFILSFISVILVLVNGSLIYQFANGLNAIQHGNSDPIHVIVLIFFCIIGSIPGVALYGFGKIVEAAHVYVEINRER